MKNVKIMRGALIAIPVSWLAAFAPPASADDDFLDRLEGTWNGKGLVRKSGNSPEEAMRCRLGNDWIDEGTGNERFRIYGPCVVADLIIPIQGFIMRGEGLSYSSTLFGGLAGIGDGTFEGERDGEKLELRFSGTHPETGAPLNASLIISALEEGFRIKILATDSNSGKSFDVGEISFESAF